MPAQDSTSYLLTPEQLANITDYSLLARIAVHGLLPGLHRSAYPGGGCEFRQYRNYTPGDDLRNVDWKLLAKHNRYYTKIYEDETNVNCLFLLDASGSMGYKGTRSPCSKLHYAATAVAVLAYLALRQGDRVGLVAYNSVGPDGLKTNRFQVNVPLSGNSDQLYRLSANMQRLTAQGQACHEEALNYAAQKTGGKSMIVVLSDFLEAEDRIKPLLKRIRTAQNDCIVLHVLDDDEIDLPFDQTTRFCDSESGNSVITSPPQVREHYTLEMETFLQEIQRGCREAQIDYLRTQSSQDVANILAAYLHHRRSSYSC